MNDKDRDRSRSTNDGVVLSADRKEKTIAITYQAPLAGEEEESAVRRLGLKIGAASVILGGLVVFVARAAHGDLPTDTGANALSYVADFPIYHIAHLAANLGVLLWAAGFYALSSSLSDRTARAVGRVASAAVLIGAAVYIVDFSIDGYALSSFANLWVDASPAERGLLAFGAEVVKTALGGISLSSLLILWGVAPMLYGVAARREGYPRWLSWSGVTIGATMFATAVAQFVVSTNQTEETTLGLVVYAGLPLLALLWSMVLGAVMWRRTPVDRSIPVDSHPAQGA